LNNSVRKNILLWLPFAAISGVIFFLSSQSHLPIPGIFEFANADKVAHVCVFSSLGAAAAYALLMNQSTSLIRVLLAVSLTVFYGMLDEAHQYFVPGREVSLGDLCADLVGGIVGVSAWLFVRKKAAGQKAI